MFSTQRGDMSISNTLLGLGTYYRPFGPFCNRFYTFSSEFLVYGSKIKNELLYRDVHYFYRDDDKNE